MPEAFAKGPAAFPNLLENARLTVRLENKMTKADRAASAQAGKGLGIEPLSELLLAQKEAGRAKRASGESPARRESPSFYYSSPFPFACNARFGM
jgi:hypothetical protein